MTQTERYLRIARSLSPDEPRRRLPSGGWRYSPRQKRVAVAIGESMGNVVAALVMGTEPNNVSRWRHERSWER